MNVNNRSLYRSEAGYQAVMAAYEAALTQGPGPYTTQWVETQLGQTHVIVGGPEKGKPLLLFHGWNGSAAGIGEEFSFLFERYRVYMPDIVGHAGKSAGQRPSPAGSTFPDWVVEVMDALQVGRAHMMGISGGGWLVLKTAAYQPDRIHKAVVLNPDGLTGFRMRKLLPALGAAIFRDEASVRRMVRLWSASDDAFSPRAEAFAQAMVLTMKHFKTQYNPGRIPKTELQRVTCPTCLFIGEHDVFKPAQGIAQAQRWIPGLAIAEIVPGAGHVLIEQPLQKVGERVMRFLNE